MHAAILAILVGFAGTALQSQSALSQEYSVVAPAFPSMPVDTAMARALFERFRGLDGEWEGRSTRGWEDSMSWRTIAGGSVAMQTSFEAHPGETMVTMISLDSGRLALTHYCVAGNQPRMIATACSPDGREVDFTFRDGGNLASRDLGHMDRAIFRFHEDGTMTSRWTWYQKGKERWMEEISYRRMR
jgi:hypothetical protein